MRAALTPTAPLFPRGRVSLAPGRAAKRTARGNRSPGLHRRRRDLARSMKRGDILTIAAQGDDGKPRPAVVVQSDALNAADSVLVAPFTSVIADAPLYRLTIAPTATNGLKSTSQMMVVKVLACPRQGYCI